MMNLFKISPITTQTVQSIEIEVSNLSQGNYIVRLQYDGKASTTHALIIE